MRNSQTCRNSRKPLKTSPARAGCTVYCQVAVTRSAGHPEVCMLVNTADMKTQIQAEIDNHLAKAASLKEKLGKLEEKLGMLGQLEREIESLANEMGVKPGEGGQRAAAAPDPKPAKAEVKLEVKPEVKMEVATA